MMIPQRSHRQTGITAVVRQSDRGSFPSAGRFSPRQLLQPQVWLMWSYAAVAVLFFYVMAMGGISSPWHFTTLIALLTLGLLWWAGACGIGKRLRPALDRIPIFGILVLAFLLRAVWVLISGVQQTSDFLSYDQEALRIAVGGTWIKIDHPSGASLFYALPYALFGHAVWFNQLVLAVLSTLQVALVYDIAQRTTLSARAGKMAALVLTFWPEHVIFNNLLCSDVPFATLGLLAIWLAGRHDRPVWIWAGAAGIVLGAANWVRPNAPILLAATLVFLLGRNDLRQSCRRRIGLAATAVAGFLLLVFPVAWMNYCDHRVLSIMTSQCGGGFNILYGTNVLSRGYYNQPDRDAVEAEISRRGIPPGVHPVRFRSQVAGELGWQRLRQQPAAILALALRHKLVTLWAVPANLAWSLETSRFAAFSSQVAFCSRSYHFIMLGLTAGALIWRRKQLLVWDERWIFMAAVLLASLSHVVLEVQARYHHGFLPFFALCVGSYGIEQGSCS